MVTAAQLSTQLLVQFLAAVSTCADEAAAVRVAAERTAAALEAEAAAVVFDTVVSTVGFPRGAAPTEDLLAVVARSVRTINVPGVGACDAMSAPLDHDGRGHLMVARSGGDGFTAEESNFLRGMARTLHLALTMLRTLEAERAMRERSEAQAAENEELLGSLRGRHHLLEQLMDIQRAISRRAPLEQVLDSIVAGAHELLDDEFSSLRLLDVEAPERFIRVTSHGLPAGAADVADAAETQWHGGRATEALSFQAIAADRVIVAQPLVPTDTGDAAIAAMAAPVHEGGRAVGALVVGSSTRAHSYSETERATLAAFAQQVSLAITDARTLEDVRQANHDPLTGLASRRLFIDRLSQAIPTDHSQPRAALLFIDLDRFKAVNDALGHAAGDVLLIEIADRLRGCLRANDGAARFGGDEFAVLLRGVYDERQAIEVAERILTAVRQPVDINGSQLFVDASIGIVGVSAGGDAESLIRDADVAMYEAKRAGSGRHASFELAMRTRFDDRVALEADLRGALDDEQFVLQYQPIVDVADGRIECVEALVRWAHPTRGTLPPLSFIPLAEDTGLILPLGEWILRKACTEAATWPTYVAGRLAPSVTVNLSGRQLQEPDLPRVIARALADTGLDPASLILEITESVLLLDSASALTRLRELKDLGLRLAVDDFGTGYSSLRYLRSFPVDILKVDKWFVDGIATDIDAANLVAAIINLGTTMHLRTVAEGIETAEQLDVLRKNDCRLGQGFFFSRPLDPPALRELLSHPVPAEWGL
ncbi:MAG TPA: EAL domain-containing protein [Acidothermaceae bacterium]|jgi:diguanylate cyclase (GGDEF)-like protein